MTLPDSFWRLAVAVGLGLLIGLQRERAAARLAGLRSFALFSLFGYLCGVLGGWSAAAGFLALAAVLVAGNIVEDRSPEADPGVTTETAALIVFGNGVYLASGSVALGTAFGVVVAALLAFKVELHSLARRTDDADFKAAVQLALLSFVILPVLPDQTYGPYGVFNPRNVWWMVLLIVSIGFVGYLAHKFMPSRSGILLSGCIGGLVSSTATTVSYARRVVHDGLSPAHAATIVVMASSVVFARLLLEIAVAAPGWLWQAAPPLLILLTILAAMAGFLWHSNHADVTSTPLSNPSQIGVAIMFGVIYTVVLFAVAAARDFFGDRGLYLVAAISGITDVDAITLSTARLVQTGSLDGALGWRVVVTATLSNLVAKAAMATVFGGARFGRQLAIPFGGAILAGLAVIWLW